MRIVHLTHHPLALCYAIYSTGFTARYPFAYDLSELGEFYLGYRRLMDHWHRTLPGRILDVAHADLARQCTSTTARLRVQLEAAGIAIA